MIACSVALKKGLLHLGAAVGEITENHHSCAKDGNAADCADMAMGIASQFASLGEFVTVAASKCQVQGNLETKCASAALGVTSALTEVGEAGTMLARTCPRPGQKVNPEAKG